MTVLSPLLVLLYYLADICSSNELDPAAELTPALLVLNKLVGASETIKLAVKQTIFPPESDKVKDAVHYFVTC